MAIFNTINEAVRYGFNFNGEEKDYSSDAAYSIYQLVCDVSGIIVVTDALSLGYDPHSLPDMINLLVCRWLDMPLVGESESITTDDGFDPANPIS